MIRRLDSFLVVVDRDVSDIVLSKSDIGEHADHSGVSAKTGEVFRQHDRYTIRFDLIQHGLEAGTVKIRSAVSVVHEKDRMKKMMFPA